MFEIRHEWSAILHRDLSFVVSRVRRYFGLVGSAVAIFIASIPSPGEELNVAAVDLLAGVVAQRQSITSLVADVTSTTSDIADSRANSEWKGRFWIDGDRLRCDRVVSCSPEQSATKCTTTDCFNCLAPNLHVHFSASSPFFGAQYAVTVSDLGQLPFTYYCPDLRFCGINPFRFLETPRSPPLSKETLARYESMSTLKEAVLGGQLCWLIEYVFPGTTQRFWLRRDPSPFILRAEVEWELGNRRVVQTIAAQPWDDRETGISLPHTLHFERFEDGLPTTREETLIQVLLINEPVDPTVFALQVMPFIPKDTDIHWVSTTRPPLPGRMIWNGEEIVPGPAQTGAVAQTRLPSRSSFGTWLLSVNAIALTWLGVVLILRARRSGSNTK